MSVHQLNYVVLKRLVDALCELFKHTYTLIGRRGLPKINVEQ